MPSTNGHKKLAILYARVSSDEQAKKGYSIGGQLDEIEEYAEERGWQIVGVETDPGYSRETLWRPGLDRVRQTVAAGGVDVIEEFGSSGDVDVVFGDGGDDPHLDVFDGDNVDTVNCGGGEDVALADPFDRVANNCELVSEPASNLTAAEVQEAQQEAHSH